MFAFEKMWKRKWNSLSLEFSFEIISFAKCLSVLRLFVNFSMSVEEVMFLNLDWDIYKADKKFKLGNFEMSVVMKTIKSIESFLICQVVMEILLQCEGL